MYCNVCGSKLIEKWSKTPPPTPRAFKCPKCGQWDWTDNEDNLFEKLVTQINYLEEEIIQINSLLVKIMNKIGDI